LLELKNLDVGYGFLQILWDVSLQVKEGEFVALIGPNGAGKTTTMRTIAGLLTPMGGDVWFRGTRMNTVPAHKTTEMGISYISESLNLFVNMTVRENLLTGAYLVRDRDKQMETLDFVYRLFPRLKNRESQLAGTMSGGERKMLAIARGMMSNPNLLLVDEPSLGLAPHLVSAVFHALQRLQETGVTILLVEQRVTDTLKFTDRAYVLEHGRIVMEGRSRELLTNKHVKSAYLGI
jgi:ABC-type branched-subunit amino acid transport system ATPase component